MTLNVNKEKLTILEIPKIITNKNKHGISNSGLYANITPAKVATALPPLKFANNGYV